MNKAIILRNFISILAFLAVIGVPLFIISMSIYLVFWLGGGIPFIIGLLVALWFTWACAYLSSD